MIELEYALDEETRKRIVSLGLKKQYKCGRCGRVYHIMHEQVCFECVDCREKGYLIYDY